MKRLLRACLARPAGFIKACRDKCLAKLRAHVALGVAEDFRQLAHHVTTERQETTAETQLQAQSHAERILLEIVGQAQDLRQSSDKKFDELTMVTESLVMEIVRMQRLLAQVSAEMADRLDPSQRTELRLTEESLPVRRAA
jgi:hypothetical protein